MALLRWLLLLTMWFLVSVSSFQSAMSRGCGRSTRKRVRGNIEHLKVEQHDGIVESDAVNSTSDQTMSKVTGNQNHPIQFHEKTVSQNNGRSKFLSQRKMKPKFHCKRQIPGGPDPQHHSDNGK